MLGHASAFAVGGPVSSRTDTWSAAAGELCQSDGSQHRMPEANLAEIERKLDAGEWLGPGQVAALFNTSRTSVDRWLRSGRITYRRGPTGRRELNPADVRRELDEYRQERRNGTDGPRTG